MRLLESNLESLITDGTRIAAGDAQDPSAQSPLFWARVKESDYARADARRPSEDGEQDPDFARIRSDIALGNLEDAENAASALLADPDLAEKTRAECLLELARIQNARGRFAEAVKVSTEALACPELPSVSRLTLLQIRANAWLELSAPAKAALDLDQARSLLLLYPQAPSAFYLEALQAKLLAEMGSRRECLQLLGRMLQRLRREKAMTLDHLLTILRVEALVYRLSGEPFERSAYAAILICQTTGDTLYEALGWAELSHSFFPAVAAQARKIAAPGIERFERARALFQKLSQTRVLGDALEIYPDGDCGLPLDRQIKRVFYVRHGIVADLDSKQVTFVKLADQDLDLLDILALGSQSEETFFERAWSLRYHPERHRATLKTALKRLRDHCGINVRLRDGQVEIDDRDWVMM